MPSQVTNQAVKYHQPNWLSFENSRENIAFSQDTSSMFHRYEFDYFLANQLPSTGNPFHIGGFGS
jgi:hypothetical protein